ncbi:MAG TPA: ABC transporter substrate-binding protein/permease [Candidatus Polarisedimenticolia bacterium]|nr:ABC transporter substrate-binding protein/permease [Candidatus Polarisedimenticolia bacterium]
MLRWGSDAEGGAPYIYKDPGNPDRNIGWEVDLAEALEQKLGARIQFVQYDYHSLVPGLQRGDFDFAMDGLEVTPDRKTRVLFSRPYYVLRLQMVVRAGDTRFTDIAGCRAAGCRVGTLEDTLAERTLRSEGLDPKIYDGVVEPYHDLAIGRLDAVLLDLPIAIYYAKPNRDLQLVGDLIGHGYYAIAFPLGATEMQTRFDAALDELLRDGTMQQINEKWGLENADQQSLLQASSDDILTESRQQWTFARYFPFLLRGAWITIQLSFASFALAILIGLPIALMRLYGAAPLRWFAIGYVEFFRGIPVLILLYFLYYGLADLAGLYPWLGVLRLGPMQSAIIGLGLNYGSYEAEVYRAGVASVPAGQWEAAASLGMPSSLTFRRIILPQAIRTILPPMTNDFVALFKDTSIVSMIAVVELSKQYQILSKSSMKYLEIGLMTALLYLLMSVPLGALSRRLEKIWGKGII